MIALRSLFSEGKSIDDWLSPILVKELRQGMRARVFLIAFLLLQVFLSVLVLANLAVQGDRQALDQESYFFWVIIGFALLILMPLRGLVTISTEVKNRCMETITLTRMTAWRVVFGKWSALFAQSLLLVTAALPYVVLRYFIGGDDVVEDIVWLVIFLWLSAIFTAVSITISGLTNLVVRIILLVGLFIVCFATWVGGFSRGGGFAMLGFTSTTMWEIAGWLAIIGFFVPALLFELTASSLAPASENHAIRRRFFAVAFFLASLALASQTKSGFELGLSLPFLVLVGVCYYELAEKPRVIARMVRTFAQKGLFGRMAAIFLLPGWPSALLFSLLVIPAAMAAVFLYIPPDATVGWLFPIFAIFGSVLVPIFICHTFWPKLEQVLLIVVLYNIIIFGVVMTLLFFGTVTHFPVDPLLAFIPSLPVLSLSMNAYQGTFKDNVGLYFLGNVIVIGLFTGLLVIGSRRYFNSVFSYFRPAADLPPVPNPPADTSPSAKY